MKLIKNTHNKANIFLISLIIFFAFLQVMLLNIHSTSGEAVSVIQDNLKEIREENIKLSQKIASSSSLSMMVQKAEDYGFSSSQTTISLSSPLSIALSGKSSL